MIKFMFKRTTLNGDEDLIFRVRKALRIRKDVKIAVLESMDSFDAFTLAVDVPYSEKRVQLLHSLLKNASLPITNVWRLKNDNVRA